jgi:hypothetical protein
MFTFWLKFKIQYFCHLSNLAFVVTFWYHNVTWKLGCFLAAERSGFSLLYQYSIASVFLGLLNIISQNFDKIRLK